MCVLCGCLGLNYHKILNNQFRPLRVHLPRIDASRCEVQLVFGLEDERLGADLHDGWRLHRCGNGEQSELWGNQRPVLRHAVLTVDEFQAATEVQGLETSKGSRAKLTYMSGFIGNLRPQ